MVSVNSFMLDNPHEIVLDVYYPERQLLNEGKSKKKVSNKKICRIKNNKGELIGIITDGDIRRCMNKDFMKFKNSNAWMKLTEILYTFPNMIKNYSIIKNKLNKGFGIRCV